MTQSYSYPENGQPVGRETLWRRLLFFMTPVDGRYEDLRGGPWYLIVCRDFSAGLIVAMVAIPLAMGFAMASGLRPEQGIVGGAVAGLVGALFGGSKYQVYGPTAAFIPIIAGLMTTYALPDDPYAGHGFLVLAALLAGITLMVMGLTGTGKLVRYVPHSIVVGFTIGIAATIALSQIREILGLDTELKGAFFSKLATIAANIDQFNGLALLLAISTFLITRELIRISIYIPAPLIAIGLVTAAVATSNADVRLVSTAYGSIPQNLLVFSGPVLPDLEYFGVTKVFMDLVYFVVAIVFVSAVESLLCSRMADRLADNRGTPFNPNKEFWGQGMVQIFVPLLNGFPHTGALARTATNIKVGAVTPLAGIFKCVLKLLLAYYLATSLELVPLACIGGILMWVAFNMVKPAEVKQVLAHNRFHVSLMIYTAAAVIITDFLTGVLTALVLYAVLHRWLDRPSSSESHTVEQSSDEHSPVAAGADTGADTR